MRRLSLNRGALLASVLLSALAGCTVDTGSLEGKSCDETHPCPSPLVCGSEGVCQSDPDGQSPGNGNGQNGNGNSCVTWSQSTHGFDSQEACPSGCLVSIASGAGNALTTEVPGTTDGSDFAFARVTGAARMPTTEEGRLRGTFSFSAASDVREYIPFVVLRTTSGQTLIELGIDGSRNLRLLTDPGVLQAGAPSPTTSTQDFRPGQAFTVDISWKKNGVRTLRIDGAEILQSAGAGGATLSAVPGSLLLGITKNDGTDNSPVQLSLEGFVLCNSATAALP